MGIVSSTLCLSWTPGESMGGYLNGLAGKVNPYQQGSRKSAEQQSELSRILHSISASTAYIPGSPADGLGGGQLIVENKECKAH